MSRTMQDAVSAASLVFGVIPSVQSVPAERVPLAMPVRLYNGVEAVVCGRSTCDSQRYELTWFDRHFWQVRRRWLHRSQFEVIATNETATAA